MSYYSEHKFSDPATYPDRICVNVWDADVYGNGEVGGLRFAVYLDEDTAHGPDTTTVYDQGPFPKEGGEWVQSKASEDDWLYGTDAYRFMLAVWGERVEHCGGALK